YRAKTSLEHHIDDLERLGEAKSDPSHFEEMKEGWLMNPEPFEEQMKLYEKEWGAPVWDFDFRVQNDVLHYHVWTQSEMVDIIRYLGFDILYVADYFQERPDSFIVVSRKPSQKKQRSLPDAMSARPQPLTSLIDRPPAAYRNAPMLLPFPLRVSLIDARSSRAVGIALLSTLDALECIRVAH